MGGHTYSVEECTSFVNAAGDSITCSMNREPLKNERCGTIVLPLGVHPGKDCAFYVLLYLPGIVTIPRSICSHAFIRLGNNCTLIHANAACERICIRRI